MKQPLEKSLGYHPKQIKNPGPSDYTPNFDFLLKKRMEGIHFSRFERFGDMKEKKKQKHNSLGPGDYNIEEKNDGPQYRFDLLFLHNFIIFFKFCSK